MSNSIDAVAERIVQALGEPAEEAQRHIRQIVTVLGTDLAETLLETTLTTEAAGGMMTLDGARRRTPGGVYFHLARQRLTHAQRLAIFGDYWRRQQRERQKTGTVITQSPTAPVAELVEGMIPQIVRSVLSGEARTVKVTLIGRPGKVVQHKDTVLLTMENRKAPSLPKGLPVPPTTPTLYTVYLTPKHWRKVIDMLKNPEDVLIVEGWQAYDPELEGIAVWGTNVTTKLLQQQRANASS